MLATVLLVLGAAESMPGVAVMDFASQGASQELAAASSSLVAHELEKLGTFRVTSAEMTRALLGAERQRQLIGCENCSGSVMSELTSFEYIVTGKVSKVGSGKSAELSLILTMLKVGEASPASSARASATSEEKLLLEAGPTAVKLVGKLLQGRQGALVVTANETGAAVKVDDSTLGTTPLKARLPLAAGPHYLSVEKNGFTAFRKDIRVAPDEVTTEDVRLVPSPDTAAEYEKNAKRLRVLAYVATGVAVAGAATFAVAQVRSTAIYGDPTTPGTFQFHRAALLRGVETEDGVDHRTEANALKAQLETWQAVSWVGIGATIVGAAAAVVLFVVGDPPGKYEAFGNKVAVQLLAGPGGVGLAGAF